MNIQSSNDNTGLIKRRKLLELAIMAGAISSTTNVYGSILQNEKDLPIDTLKLVSAIADVILPRTTSPSASDVGADVFTLDVIFYALDESVRKNFLLSLNTFSTVFEDENKQLFHKASPATQTQYFTKTLHRGSKPLHKLCVAIRKYVIIGWVLNEKVAKSNFHYIHTLGTYKPSTKSNRQVLTSNLDRLYV